MTSQHEVFQLYFPFHLSLSHPSCVLWHVKEVPPHLSSVRVRTLPAISWVMGNHGISPARVHPGDEVRSVCSRAKYISSAPLHRQVGGRLTALWSFDMVLASCMPASGASFPHYANSLHQQRPSSEMSWGSGSRRVHWAEVQWDGNLGRMFNQQPEINCWPPLVLSLSETSRTYLLELLVWCNSPISRWARSHR